MAIIKLHFIESLTKDPFKRNTFDLSVNEQPQGPVGEFTHVNEAEAWLLPVGYHVAEMFSGQLAVFTGNSRPCFIYAAKKTPVLRSAEGVVFLKKAQESRKWTL